MNHILTVVFAVAAYDVMQDETIQMLTAALRQVCTMKPEVSSFLPANSEALKSLAVGYNR
jgi:hypothetical protein